MRVPTRHHATSVLLFGLVVGLLGSYTDELLGASDVVTATQIVLWCASGVLLVTALAGLVRGEPTGVRRRPGRPTPVR